MTTDVTEPLASGDPIPDHPASDTAHTILTLSSVRDAEDDTLLTAGLHNNEVSTLMSGENPLPHLYRFAIREHDGKKRIYHTRKSVIIECEVE